MALNNHFDLDPEFFESCMNTILEKPGNQSPVSITSTLASPTGYTFEKLVVDERSVALPPDSSRLTDHYPDAFIDFYGTPSGAPCIFKTGPAWPKRQGTEAQPYIRELRPVSDHPITDSWPKIREDTEKYLASCDIMWTSVDGFGFANEGEKEAFCPLLVWIGVRPKTLTFEVAVAAAEYVKGTIVSQAGFTGIEVAFRESEVTHSFGGPKLHSFNPLVDPISDSRKPFTPTPGLFIAPLKTPHYEGTGSLYFRLRKDNDGDDDRVVLLTTAHVARPPPVHTNTGMTRKHSSQPREQIVALGSSAYEDATNSIMSTIGTLARSIRVWENNIARLGKFVEGENPGATKTRQENQYEVDRAKDRIKELNSLHDEVTKRRTNPSQRIIGFVLHAEPIVVSDGLHRFTRDWALIELYREKIDWDTFQGNKVYVGTFPISSRSSSFWFLG